MTATMTLPATDPIHAALAQFPLLILDGALATELERRGCDLNDALWSARVLLEAPELIRAVHTDYFAAGADVATTASYQASYQGFARRGLSAEQATACLQLSVQLAREARDAFWAAHPEQHGLRPRPLVAASVGPFGAMRADGSEYVGHYGVDSATLKDFHRPRLAALLAAQPDVLACETLPCQQEALALAELLAELGYAPPQPVEPRDEAAELQRQFIEASRMMSQLASRIERLQAPAAAAPGSMHAPYGVPHGGLRGVA